ncbi:terminase small subunit [Coralloluteibacterium thermophilus]|uniref:Terminase small subunit n=1 Tax=Coralloluteibacterium thermophilum TaxID=2707049 RepID=A0ABV9NNA9_9GAMM
MALTPKQARFVSEYLKDQNATQAAIRAGYSRGTAKQQGSRLLTNADVAAAVEKGQSRVAAKAEMTVQGHLADLKKLRDAAAKKGQYSAAISAEVARGKVSGYHVEHHKHSGAIGTYDLKKLSDDQLDALESILGPLAHAGGDLGGEGEAGG